MQFDRPFGAAAVFLAILGAALPGPAQESPQASLESLRPADGFEVTLWAHEPMVSNPTSIDIDSRGRVWIAEGLNYRLQAGGNNEFKRLPGADRIKILADTDGDGRADRMTVFATDLFPPPLGLAVQERWQGGVYRGARVFVGNSPNLLVLEDTDGDDRADRRTALLTGFGGIDSDHGVHGMTLGPDGWLYFTQGDARYGRDDLGAGAVTFDVTDRSGRRLQSSRSGTNMRVRLDGKQLEVIACGQRNNYGTCVDSFDHIFTTDNDDDGKRGCRVLWTMDGGNYGYRAAGSPRHWAEELPGYIPKLVGTGNGAPGGVVVYEGDLFPKPYFHSLLQVDSGTHQVNFHPLERYGAAFRSAYRVLLRGEDSWFRPVDLAVAPDGSLFVCDWYDAGVGGNRFSDQTTGRLYRLAPTGSPTRPAQPDFATLEGALAALRSPNVATRFAARQALLRRGGEARAALVTLVESGRPHQRARALLVLADLPEPGPADVRRALQDDDPRIRELALRILARDLQRESVVAPKSAREVEPPAVRVLADILPLAEDADAGVRRELLLALRHVEAARAGAALRQLALAWDGQDRYYLEALRAALRERPARLIKTVFAELTGRAAAHGGAAAAVALPPYFPVTTNESFLPIGAVLAPASAVSKVVGLAWALQRAEAVPALRGILAANDSAAVARAADLALGRIDDPSAAELLVDRFLAVPDTGRRREILQLLGLRLAGPWQPVRDRPDTTRMLDAALGSAPLRVEAVKTIARGRIVAYADRLMQLVADEHEPASTRAAALEALGQLKHGPARTLAVQRVDAARSTARAGPVARAALSVLSALPGADRRQLLVRVAADRQYPLDLRRQALQILGTTASGGRAVLRLVREKRLAEDLNTEARFLLLSHPDQAIRAAAKRELPRPQTAAGHRIEDLDAVLARRGDPQKGRVVFQRDPNNACSRCHRVQGAGSWVGPDLSSIGTKYGKRELLYHILNPSGAINFNFVSYAIATNDGRVLSGLVTSEDAGQVVIKTAQGERLVIPADEIEEKRAQNVSIMPDNLVDTISEQDLADLVSFLASLRQPVSTVGQYYLLGPVAAGTYDGASTPDVLATFPGAGGELLRWRRVAADGEGFLDLSSLLGSGQDQEVFCYIPLISNSRQAARLVVNSAQPIAAWHQGAPVAIQGSPAPARLWEGAMTLAPGRSAVVLRVSSGPSPAGLVTTLITDREIRYGFD